MYVQKERLTLYLQRVLQLVCAVMWPASSTLEQSILVVSSISVNRTGAAEGTQRRRSLNLAHPMTAPTRCTYQTVLVIK